MHPIPYVLCLSFRVHLDHNEMQNGVDGTRNPWQVPYWPLNISKLEELQREREALKL